MAEVTTGLVADIINAYDNFLGLLPSSMQNFINLFLLVILVVVYSIIIWKFYTFISNKDILKLNLSKYNTAEHPLWERTLAGVLYLIEYIIIIPFLIFFWFVIMTFFLILMTEGLEVGTILVISAVVISAIRMTAYYKHELSRELAKLLPFTLLSIAMLTKGLFDFERILGNFSQLSVFFDEVAIYLLFIILLEVLLRFLDFIFSLFGFEEEGEEEEGSEKD